jgi:hypothetical protein
VHSFFVREIYKEGVELSVEDLFLEFEKFGSLFQVRVKVE